MRQLGERIGILILSGLVSYKLSVIAFAPMIPGDPFYGSGRQEWLAWFFNKADFIYLVAALLVEYGLLYGVTRRLSLSRLAVWSTLLGPYFAWLLFPFDQLARIDTLPDQYWPSGLTGAVLEVLVFFVLLPLIAGLVLSRLRRPHDRKSDGATTTHRHAA
jgi:hypothetical protein